MNLGDGTPQQPLHSATVVMLRDAPAGLEVFLLERHGLSDVLGGAYVFPGGKLDRQDLETATTPRAAIGSWRHALGEPELEEVQAAALFAAAIREAFEESGVRLEAASLVPWSRWVTPAASVRARKHFDARFFLAVLPPGQVPVHDEHETTASAWLAPAAALQAYWQGRIQLAPPQIMSLAQLSCYRDTATALAAASSRKPPRIQPEVFQDSAASMVCFPGDPRHSLHTRVMPGPTRLYWRAGRYEPEAGVDFLLAL